MWELSGLGELDAVSKCKTDYSAKRLINLLASTEIEKFIL